MVILVIICLLIIASMILAPKWVVKISSFTRLKKWQRVVINCCIVGFVYLSPFIVMVVGEYVCLKYGYPQSKSPKVARAYLEDIDINIVIPEFKVESHVFEFTGGDDTQETWKISFKQPLSQSLISKLDSLCRVDYCRWRKDRIRVGHGTTSDDIDVYTFSYWDPVMIEHQETVIIDPVGNNAFLIHRKI